MKAHILPLFLLGFVLFVYRTAIPPELPYTHDSQSHIARMGQYYLAVKQGQLPPRWAPGFNNGFGYPVFVFNYPLANMLSVPLIVANVPIQYAFSIIYLAAMLGGTMGFYFLLRQIVSPYSSFTGSLLYAINPYQANLLLVRGAIGETMVFATLPWMMYFLSRSRHSKTFSAHLGLIITMILFLLSHNILVLFSAPVMMAVLIFAYLRNRPWFSRIVTSGIVALMLVSWFWLPAMLERKYTNLDQVGLIMDYAKHFPQLNQLLHDAFSWGFSLPGPVDGMSFSVGIFGLLLLILGISVALYRRRHMSTIYVLYTLLLIYTFMSLPISLVIWEQLPILHYAQFPWRLVFYITSLLAIVGGLTIEQLRARRVYILILGLLMIFQTNSWRPIDQFSYDDDYWLSFTQTSSVLDENMPVWFDKFRAYELIEEWFAADPVHIEGAGSFSQTSWTGTKRTYTIDAREDVIVYERGAYYPGWRVGETKLGNLPISYSQPGNPGLVSYQLPAGRHEITSSFTQRTPGRLVGYILGIVGLSGIVFLYTQRDKPFIKANLYS